MSARSKRAFLIVCCLIGAIAVLGVLAAAPKHPAKSGNPTTYASHVPGEVLVRFKDSAGASERAQARTGRAASRLRQFRNGGEHWRLGPGETTEQAIAALRENPNVKYAEPNYIVHSDTAPNDARYLELWGMNNTGQTGGTAGADIDAERAWNVSTGSPSVVVAVIDTGVDYNHPDLAANIWSNPGEIAGNGVDDDGNGFIDDIHGWDFANNDNNPFDDNGHGSHCSGTIGAVGNNGIGVAGVNWHVSIMGVKFLDAGGSGTTAGAVAAIDYARMMHVSVMSNSWGGGGFSQTLLDSINAAAAQEIVFVAAAGNSNTDNDVTPHYPSNYDAPNVIAVAATDHDDAKASFSSYGATTVDLGAPGVDILSTTPGNTYSLFSGTSMATPHVAGAAALLRAVAPNTSAALVRQILMNFADPVPSMQGITVSGGRLNAFFPIAEPDDVAPGDVIDLATTGATSNSLVLAWTATGDDGNVGTASEYDLRYSTSPINDASFGAATRATGIPAPGPSGSPQSAEVLGLVAGTPYYFALKARDEWGNLGPLSNVATGTTLPAPTFASSPASFSASLLTGQSTTRTLTIQNAGVGTLDWRIPLPTVSGAAAVTQHEALALDKLDPDPRPGIPALEGFGGPDGFGYRWVDSDQPGGPAFSWTDIATTGTPIGLDADDQNAGPIPIGFNFPFYGNNFDTVRVSTNGWISFSSTATSYANQPLPNTGAPANLIAPFWDDLHFRGVQRATYANVNGGFVVQFTDVDRYATGSNLTFQVELQPSGEIRLRYLSMVGVLDNATVGIQNATATDGLNVVFNSTYVHDGLEVRIAAVPQWLTASPTSGRLFGGQSANVTVTIDATGLDGGAYTGSVNVGTNDPLRPAVGHPVSLTVTGAPAIAVSPLSIDFGQVFLGFSGSATLSIQNTGTDALTVSSIDSGDPQVTVSPASLTVPAHSGASVAVSYTPTVVGGLATSLTVHSNASNAAQVTVDVAGSAAPAPGALVSPTSFSETLYTGGVVTRSLDVRNTGGSNLVVALSVELGAAAQLPPQVAELPKGDESDAGTGDNVIERAGGPDAFGYRYRDSDAPGGPAFAWVDISSVGTPIPFSGTQPDDTNFGPINIGFNFPFYGNTFNSIRACSNGWISFTSTATSFSNLHVPTGGTTAPNNLLAAFWDDLVFYTANGARAYTYNDGSRFIVQFKNVSKFNEASTSLMNFEFILYPNGRVVFQYLNMSGTLNSATIGIQNATRDVGLETSFNENYVHNNLAIEYFRVPDWLEVAPTSATIPPGQTARFNVTFNAGDSGDRVFQGAIRINTNIPDPPTISVPATLTVLGVADVATDPVAVDYGSRFVGYPQLQQLAVKNVGTGDLTVSDVTSNDPSLFVEAPPAASVTFVIPPGGEILYSLRWVPTAPSTLNALVTVSSDDPDEPTLTVPVIGVAIPAPILGYSPGSFSDSLFVGEQSLHNLHLTNSGGSDLTFSIGVRLTDAIVAQHQPVVRPKGVEPPTHGAPVTEASGGPDMFGYRFKDSDEPGGPSFDWFDISSIGTPLAGLDGDDELSAPIPIGFDFSFYGNTFNSLRVSTNGWLSFTSTVLSGSGSYGNQQLPTGGTTYPENLLAPFWDDLDFDGLEQARFYGDGTRFIIQYTDVAHYPGGAGAPTYTFQIVLYPTGRMAYQYLTMNGALDSMTVGIQNATRDDGLNIAFEQPYLHDGLTIEIQSIADWLTVDLSSGTVPPGGALDIPVHFDATDLIGGTYHGGLRLLTNDPASGLVELPATLVVTGFPAIVAAPAALDFGTVFVGVSPMLPLTISNPGSDVLNVSHIAVTGDYALDTTPFALAPGATRILPVTFAPTTQGARPGSITFTSNATGMPLVSVALTGAGLLPPVAEVDEDTVEEVADVALPPGGSKTEKLRLYNTGDSNLVWTASVTFGTPAASTTPPEIQPAVELPKGDTSADGTGWHIERTGGPDAFGYRYRDSDEPTGPVFDWLDISSIGTPVAGLDGDDEFVGPITLPFNVPYYGNSFGEIWASSNGWISFTEPTSSSLTNYPLPNTLGQANQVAPFWDDLDFEGVEKATTYYDGSRFIIQYTDVEHYPGGTFTTSYTFQIILYPSGRIVFQYLTLSGNLTSHTIGIQDASKAVGLGVTYNEDPPYAHDNLALEFYTVPEWLTLAPTSGVIAPSVHGHCHWSVAPYNDITLNISAVGVEPGDYPAVVTLLTNDPFHSRIDVPVTLHVGQVQLTYTDVDPNPLYIFPFGFSVRAALQLPTEYDPHDIDIRTVSVNGQLYAKQWLYWYSDENHDGVLERVVRFDRQQFQALVPEGDSVEVTITGEVHDVTWFTGTDHIRVVRPKIRWPHGHGCWILGQAVTLDWDPPQNGNPSSYHVELSRDGGETWETLASNVSATQYTWSVSGPGTDQARIRVVAMDWQGAMGSDTSDEDYSIATQVYAPAPVSDLVISRNVNQAHLSWKVAVPDSQHGVPTTFRVLTSTVPNGAFTELGTSAVDWFEDPLATGGPGSLVFYRVTAVNSAGESQ